MQAQIKLGRIFGIQIGLQYSWLIIALLVTLSLAGQFEAENPQWGGAAIWATAIVTSLLFFFAIVLHELSHAAVAKRRGLPVRSITLFALGGMAQMEKEPGDAKTEFWMAIVGPIASAIIGALCLLLAWALGSAPTGTPTTPAVAMLMWLGAINIGLAIFNMIPGYPLDGGRVLRAIIWWSTGDAARSTRIASSVGQFVGFGFMVFGILRFVGGAGFGGLWIAFIGWFLFKAARGSYQQLAVAQGLRGLRAVDVMSNDCPVVSSRDNLQTLVDDHVARTGKRWFIVEDQGSIVGLITPAEIKAVPRNRWPYTIVDDVMRPLAQLHTVAPETSAAEALETMLRDGVNQLPVVLGGHLEGMVSRGHILQVLQTRAELQV